MGKIVTVNINLTWSSCATAPVGTLRVGNLPYASSNTTNLIQTIQVIPSTFTTGTASIMFGQIQPNTQLIELKISTAASIQVTSNPSADSTAGVQITGSYIAN